MLCLFLQKIEKSTGTDEIHLSEEPVLAFNFNHLIISSDISLSSVIHISSHHFHNKHKLTTILSYKTFWTII